jgi:hypothetical protein
VREAVTILASRACGCRPDYQCAESVRLWNDGANAFADYQAAANAVPAKFDMDAYKEAVARYQLARTTYHQHSGRTLPWSVRSFRGRS